MASHAFVGNLLQFGRLLRRAGLCVHHGRLLDAIVALAWVGVQRRDDVRATLRALLVHRREDMTRFDAAFDLFFRDRTLRLPELMLADRQRPVAGHNPPASMNQPAALEAVVRRDSPDIGGARVAYSREAVPRAKDFAAFTATELEEARRLLERLPWRLGGRRTRRWERAAASTVDLRPLLRAAFTRGELAELTYRRRRVAPRPIVFIGDVSGSMERYSRVLLHFVYGLARHVRDVESFVFATSLTRLTHRLTQPGAAGQLALVVRSVTDWGGGTRIGESLRVFNTRWARRVMRHGPVVLLVSDGWDRGEPDVLTREIARLRRNCHRLIWLNPLLGQDDYEPLTRGMQAALPYVDDFLPAHNIASLEQLAEHLTL